MNHPFSILIIILIIIFFIFILIRENVFFKKTITRSSIKESLDKLNVGLCFSHENGMIILNNQCMSKLCHTIIGRDFKNANSLWEVLLHGEIKLNIERLSIGSRPIFRVPDGSVWTFTREELNGIVQLSATDTTQVYEITEELRERNIELARLNLRLKKYGENVDELTRSKERIETKARIHSELGQALLTTRHYFVDGDNAKTPPLDIWKRCIALLRKQAEIKNNEHSVEMLSRVARATGITLYIDGKIPKYLNINKLFVQASAEALTNAVRHANAKTLEIMITEIDDTFTLCITNSGESPKGDIIEGGGLSSLRKKVEDLNGVMTVVCRPKYMLIITVAKEEGDLDD